MPRLKLAMMGTGDFAVPTFEGLYNTPHEVVALFTQPPREGRGHHKHSHNDMQKVAETHATPVFHPQKANTPASLDQLRQLNLDLLVVAAYGQILSAKLLSIPRLGAINLHASLLPKYRGAAPVNYAILCGETETGVTIFQIEPSLDAGPMLGVVKTDIGPEETTGELEKRLANLAAPLAQKVIEDIAEDRVTPILQTDTEVTKAPKMKKQMGAIDWNKSANEVDCHIRAMQPWPKPYTFWHHNEEKPLRLVIRKVRTVEAHAAELPGTVLESEPNQLLIQTGSQPVEIIEIQPDGKRNMSATDFLRGHTVPPRDRFGPE